MKVYDPNLKRCPFCGERAELVTSELNGKLYYIVGCGTHGCREFTLSQNEADPNRAKIIAQWNARPKSIEQIDKKLADQIWELGGKIDFTAEDWKSFYYAITKAFVEIVGRHAKRRVDIERVKAEMQNQHNKQEPTK